METILLPSASCWSKKNFRLAELLTPYMGFTLIRPLYKKGIKWVCEIVDLGAEESFSENEFFFL